MIESESFLPQWASPPGGTVSDILEERGVSLSDFARKMGWSPAQAQQLVLGQTEIDKTLAAQLAKALGASDKFWLSREKQYRDDLTRLGEDKESEQKAWLRTLPIKDMVDWGWIPSDAPDRAKACLNFFGSSNIAGWHTQYDGVLRSAAFRSSSTFRVEPPAVAAWLRKGEIDANKIQSENWDSEKFKETLGNIRPLTRKHDPGIFIPELQRLCSECGVALVIAPAPKGCRASGATRFLSKTKALILLSFRYLSDDHFWFTFFHEAGHLLLHDRNALFLEGSGMASTDEEEQADEFSEDFLIPRTHRAELLSLSANKRSVILFAHKLGISPGIVIGQLQHHKKIGRDKLNFLKRRYSWA